MSRAYWKIKSDRKNGGYILYDDEGREISTPDLDSATFLFHSLNRKHKDAFEDPPITDKLRVTKIRDK